MINPSKSVWSKGSKAHSKKKIRLESTLSKGRGLESTLERKKRYDLHRKRWSLKKKTFWIGMVAPSNLPLGKIQKFWNGQIIVGDLSRWKMRRFFKVVKNSNHFSKWWKIQMIFQNSEKYEIFSKWSYCNGRPAQVENAKVFAKWWKMQRFFKVVENVNDFSK
jgi:hypothetical protein